MRPQGKFDPEDYAMFANFLNYFLKINIFSFSFVQPVARISSVEQVSNFIFFSSYV